MLSQAESCFRPGGPQAAPAPDGALLCPRHPLRDQTSALAQAVAGGDPGIFDRHDPEHGGVGSLSQRAVTRCGQGIDPSGGYERQGKAEPVENPGSECHCHAYPAHGGIKMRIGITRIYCLSFRLEKELWATARQDVTVG